MRCGILGGTFDPIHNGHLVLAHQAAERLHLDRVLIIPAGSPWQKRDREIAPAEHRLAMVKAAVASDPLFEVSEIDIRRTGPTYTIDMLDELAELRPADEFVLIIGADLAPRLRSWHRYEEVLARVEIVVCSRPEHPLDLSSLPDGRFVILDVPTLPISSSAVRARLDAGLDVSDLVPRPTLDYIRAHEIYGTAISTTLEDFRL